MPRPFEAKHSPLTFDILITPLPKNFKVPIFESFSNTGCPKTHTTKFVNYMQLYNTSDRLLCKVFPTTLIGTAHKWYCKLPPGSITTWKDLSTKFILRFFPNIPLKRSSEQLYQCKQKENEPLRECLERFNNEVTKIDDLNIDTAVQALRRGTTMG